MPRVKHSVWYSPTHLFQNKQLSLTDALQQSKKYDKLQTMERSDWGLHILAKHMVLFKAVDNMGNKTLMHNMICKVANIFLPQPLPICIVKANKGLLHK